ncbi:AsnC family transcriptional regulator [Cupriavidus necator]|uniref:AsnC family transcriptional regulator n=1 Tax=Cupriavidus necator TaxID=106590 RepID=UPI00339D5304
MPATALPTLRLSLRLDTADLFGAMEWVLANARRTGLAPAQLGFDASRQAVLHATMTADDVNLLWLFLRRLDNGCDVELLVADVDDPDGDDIVAEPAPPAISRHAGNDTAVALSA